MLDSGLLFWPPCIAQILHSLPVVKSEPLPIFQ